jgi:Uma2 family endonuclease
VGEYWLINADDSIVEQYVLRSGAYEMQAKQSSGRLKSFVVEGFEIDIEALFDETKNLEALRELMS